MTPLSSFIKDEILKKGDMPFVEFMNHALYHPQYGYYSASASQFGSEGDFFTAPSLTPLFGQTLAYSIIEIGREIPHPIIFEFGAGNGRLCVDILKTLKENNALPEAYWILEISPALRDKQYERINAEIPELASLVTWLDRLPETPFSGVVLANEVLDAMPVHRFMKREEGIFESDVRVSEEGQFVEVFERINETLLSHIEEKLPDVHPYLSEVNLFLETFISSISSMLKNGMVLFVDYGFPAHEYYHPDRNQGTLMCHYRQRAHPDPFIHVGFQDITAHVDFTSVKEAALLNGFEIAGYTSQGSFLLASGLLERLPADSMTPLMRQALQILIEPSEMGELIKVLALSKNSAIKLSGFRWHDRSARL